MEEIYINNINNGIRAIKLGMKTPETANVGINLNKLKPLNEGMYQDLLAKYVKQVNEYKNNLK